MRSSCSFTINEKKFLAPTQVSSFAKKPVGPEDGTNNFDSIEQKKSRSAQKLFTLLSNTNIPSFLLSGVRFSLDNLIRISPMPSKLQINPYSSKALRAPGNILGVCTHRSAQTKRIIRQIKLQISQRPCQQSFKFEYICTGGPKRSTIRWSAAICKNDTIWSDLIILSKNSSYSVVE